MNLNYKILRSRPVFICGHPKSGTSLLRSMLDGHPHLIVYPEETLFFRRYLKQAAGKTAAEQITLAEELLLHIFTWNTSNPPPSQAGYLDRDYSMFSYDAVRDAMREFLNEYPPTHEGDILAAAVLAFGEASDHVIPETGWWVEKSPYNEFYGAEIFTMWPQAKCIHIVRDPRDNYVSYQRKHKDWDALFFGANWNRSTEAGIDHADQYGSERYLNLRYEDLTMYPQETIDKICAFLDIPDDPVLAQPIRAGAGWAGNSMFADRFQAISAAPIGRWKDSLSTMDAAVIEIKSQKLMQVYQYEANSPKTFSAYWKVMTWPISQRIKRLRGLNK